MVGNMHVAKCYTLASWCTICLTGSERVKISLTPATQKWCSHVMTFKLKFQKSAHNNQSAHQSRMHQWSYSRPNQDTRQFALQLYFSCRINAWHFKFNVLSENIHTPPTGVFGLHPPPLQKFQFVSKIFFKKFWFYHPTSPLEFLLTFPWGEVWIFSGFAQFNFFLLKAT